jgi:hypothetical protein
MYKNPFENQSGHISWREVRKAGFSEQQFDIDKVKINYVEGPHNGTPLVLIPG